MGTFKIMFSTLCRRGCLFQRIQWVPVLFPPANIYSNYLAAVKAMTMGARGRTGQTNLCMGIPGLDKGILFRKTALENTPQGKLGSWTQESNGSEGRTKGFWATVGVWLPQMTKHQEHKVSSQYPWNEFVTHVKYLYVNIDKSKWEIPFASYGHDLTCACYDKVWL